MSEGDLSEQLANHPALRGLSPTQLSELARAGALREVAEGDAIVVEGESATSAFLLLEGSARIWKAGRGGAGHDLGRLEAGSVLGEVGLLGGGLRTATVEAAEPARLFAVSSEAFDELLDGRDPAATRLLRSVAEALAERQQRANERIVELAAKVADPEATLELNLRDIREKVLRGVDYRA